MCVCVCVREREREGASLQTPIFYWYNNIKSGKASSTHAMYTEKGIVAMHESLNIFHLFKSFDHITFRQTHKKLSNGETTKMVTRESSVRIQEKNKNSSLSQLMPLPFVETSKEDEKYIGT